VLVLFESVLTAHAKEAQSQVHPFNVQFHSTTIRNVAIGREGTHKFTLDTELTFNPPKVTLTLNKCASKYPSTQVPRQVFTESLTAPAFLTYSQKL